MSAENDDKLSFAGSVCGNPDCGNPGKLRCSACATIIYCSSECQKKHWNQHKASCKTLNKTSLSQKMDNFPVQLQTLKNEIQRAFQTKDMEGIKTKSDEALQLMKQLPPAESLLEIIQLYLTLSTAHFHLNRFNEAFSFAEQSIAHAQLQVSQMPNQPQPLELLSMALGCKVMACLGLPATHHDSGLEAAKNSLAIAEAIYPKNDFRLHKSLRALGLIQNKREEYSEAEKALLKAYTILCLTSGPTSPEAQYLTDDLVQMCYQKEDLEAAEKYARSNYKKVMEGRGSDGKRLTIPDEFDRDKERVITQITADSCARLATCLVKRGSFVEAEPIIECCLSLRDDPQYPSNPLGIAYTLSQLCGVKEQLGKVDETVEAMLVRALEIFGPTRGQNSPEVMNTLNQLRTVRQRRNGGATAQSPSSGSRKVDDIDDDSYRVKEESTLRSLSNGNRSSTGGASPALSMGDLTEDDRIKINSMPKNDGPRRMMLANAFFEQRKYLAANILLTEAHSIFADELGEEADMTKMARQNMMVSVLKRIEQQWLQIVSEEVLRREDMRPPGGFGK